MRICEAERKRRERKANTNGSFEALFGCHDIQILGVIKFWSHKMEETSRHDHNR